MLHAAAVVIAGLAAVGVVQWLIQTGGGLEAGELVGPALMLPVAVWVGNRAQQVGEGGAGLHPAFALAWLSVAAVLVRLGIAAG